MRELQSCYQPESECPLQPPHLGISHMHLKWASINQFAGIVHKPYTGSEPVDSRSSHPNAPTHAGDGNHTPASEHWLSPTVKSSPHITKVRKYPRFQLRDFLLGSLLDASHCPVPPSWHRQRVHISCLIQKVAPSFPHLSWQQAGKEDLPMNALKPLKRSAEKTSVPKGFGSRQPYLSDLKGRKERKWLLCTVRALTTRIMGKTLVYCIHQAWVDDRGIGLGLSKHTSPSPGPQCLAYG